MAREIFTGTQAECNAVIAKANTALGYTGSTSIDIPYPIDAANDVYEVVVKTGTQKNALSTSEKTKVLSILLKLQVPVGVIFSGSNANE